MEWLLLLVVAPAILVPIVLLGGFAGCQLVFQAEADVLPPANLTATPKSVDHITVSWENPGEQVQRYRFVRKPGVEIQRDEEVDATVSTVEDADLAAGTEYTYEVSTITEDDTSDPAQVTTSTFRTAFEVDPATSPNDQAIAPADYCFVQKIPASLLLADGSRVGLTVRGAPAGNVTINRIYISRAAGSPNVWDSADDIKPVRTSPLTLADDQRLNLDPADYDLTQTQDLIIAFDLTAAPGADTLRFVLVPGVTLFFKQGVQQAFRPPGAVRDPDYVTQPDPRLYLVVELGVL